MQVSGPMQLPFGRHLSLPTLSYPCPRQHPLALLPSQSGEAQHCLIPLVMPFQEMGVPTRLRSPLSGLALTTGTVRGVRLCQGPWPSSCATKLKVGERW